jgi:glycosyltransferase involved in cell wall biosynthesis
MPSLRILQIVDGFRMGGAENKLRELIERLDHGKYEIMLVNVGPTGPLQAAFERLGIEMFNFPRRFAFDPLPFLKLYRLMRQRRIDIVQTTLFWADFVGAPAAKLAGVPVILSWETVSHEGDPYHNNFQRRNGYRLAMKYADRIIAVSREVKESLIRRRGIPEEKIQVIYYGVDLEQFHPNGRDSVLAKRREINVRPEEFLIGIVARLEPWKGHRYFIEAFAEVAPRFPHARVILIGDGSLRSELESMTRQKKLQERISFLGVRNDVAQLVNCLDLFVLPSLPGEGLPNVLLEAMACGKPVIATQVGGVPELVYNNQNGYLAPPGNAKALSETLAQALSNRARLQQLALAGKAAVEKSFSLNQQIAAFQNTFDELYMRKTKRNIRPPKNS